MRPVNSQVLQDIARILQLTGSSSGSQQTEFEDGILQQVIDVAGMVRRGGTLADTQGIFTARIVNDHLGSDTIDAQVNPYEGTDLAGALAFIDSTWPSPIPRGFDIWILNAWAITNAANLSAGTLGILYDVNAMAWRTDDTTGIAQQHMLAIWNNTMNSGGDLYLSNAIDGALPAFVTQPTRLRRSAEPRVRFRTVKSDAGAGAATLHLTLGLFPSGLGQDAIG